MLPDWPDLPEEEQTQVNPYAPIDYTSRLHKPAQPAHSASAPPRPGSLYGGHPPQHSSPPPEPSGEMDIPSYLRRRPGQENNRRRTRMERLHPEETQEWTPVGFDPQGTPYGEMQFDTPQAPRQETAPMPVIRTEDQIKAFFQKEQHSDAPAYNLSAFSDEEEDSLRDAFQPADQPQAELPPEEPELKDAYAPAEDRITPRAKPPVRIWRVIALGVSALMLAFCCITGFGILKELDRNQREMKTFRQNYLDQTGHELHQDASPVDLLPEGQTFAPTPAPTPTAAPVTPTPAPIIPIREAAIDDLNPHSSQQTEELEQEAYAPLRSRLTVYPDNPMQNVMPGLTEWQAVNGDVTGHLVIEGLLDQVVVQRDHMYYLTHDWQGIYSPTGAVFMDDNCSLKLPPENLLLRAQCGSGGPFSPLLGFATSGPSFAGQYGWATLTTLYEENRYRLFAVIVTPSDSSAANSFHYSSYLTFGSDSEMLSYVQQVKSRSLYDFGVDVAADDRLLTLATVGNGDDCLVLVYRMARSGE